MSDYIDKWELIEKMEWDNDIEKWTIWEDDLKSIPSANVEPVRHGRWIHDINNRYGCSECMGRETMSHTNLKPYCPNCGARMDKEGEHEAG